MKYLLAISAGQVPAIAISNEGLSILANAGVSLVTVAIYEAVKYYKAKRIVRRS